MSGPLSVPPVGTTCNANVAAAGERPNKTPIFITGVGDTRAFLAWLLASCPSGLTAQLKGEKLMVVPSTADGFRAAVSSLPSLEAQPWIRTCLIKVKGKSRSSRAGLQFPLGRIHRLLWKVNYAERVRAGAPVYLGSSHGVPGSCGTRVGWKCCA
jgi:hypothetical protein